MKKPASKTFSMLLLVMLMTSCMTTRIVHKYDTDNPVPTKVTRWAFAWGLIQPKDVRTKERCKSICLVEVKNNIGFILISGLTLGAVVPMSAEYYCCPNDPPGTEL